MASSCAVDAHRALSNSTADRKRSRQQCSNGRATSGPIGAHWSPFAHERAQRKVASKLDLGNLRRLVHGSNRNAGAKLARGFRTIELSAEQTCLASKRNSGQVTEALLKNRSSAVLLMKARLQKPTLGSGLRTA